MKTNICITHMCFKNIEHTYFTYAVNHTENFIDSTIGTEYTHD